MDEFIMLGEEVIETHTQKNEAAIVVAKAYRGHATRCARKLLVVRDAREADGKLGRCTSGSGSASRKPNLSPTWRGRNLAES